MNGMQTPLVLKFGDAETRVQSLPGVDVAVQLDLAVGAGALAADVLRHTPPSPLEIERAIEIVEEAIMPVRAQLPEILQLFCADPQFRMLSGHELSVQDGDSTDSAVSHVTAQWVGIDALEHLFNRLVARAEGRPAAQDALSVDAASAARLVIVREILHHWHLEGLYLTA